MKRTDNNRDSGARRSLSARIGLFALLGAAMISALPLARGQERNFAGSVQGAYLYVHDAVSAIIATSTKTRSISTPRLNSRRRTKKP